MLTFFGSTFPLNLQLWNTIRMSLNITPLQFRCRRNYLFWLCLSDFWRPCAPLKTCPNQKSFWDPSNQPSNTTGMGWEFWFSKKHVWLGHPNAHPRQTLNYIMSERNQSSSKGQTKRKFYDFTISLWRKNCYRKTFYSGKFLGKQFASWQTKHLP